MLKYGRRQVCRTQTDSHVLKDCLRLTEPWPCGPTVSQVLHSIRVSHTVPLCFNSHHHMAAQAYFPSMLDGHLSDSHIKKLTPTHGGNLARNLTSSPVVGIDDDWRVVREHALPCTMVGGAGYWHAALDECPCALIKDGTMLQHTAPATHTPSAATGPHMPARRWTRFGVCQGDCQGGPHIADCSSQVAYYF